MSAGYLNVRAATLLRRLDIKLRACWRPLTMKKLLLLALIAVAREATAEDAKCVREHAAMIETIRAYARSDAGLLGPQGISESVLEAMGQTERHRFIPGGSCSVAYADRPVSIGQDQTISQPYIVALMTHFAEVKFDHTVLEVGTGSGYQAAILGRLVRKVCTVEIIPPLAEAAANFLRNLGYDNVSVKVGDGYHGWPECGLFDAMIVTAALGWDERCRGGQVLSGRTHPTDR
jgi:protein-L-isoaspartate(D-aspartate) O-methyltransferase